MKINLHLHSKHSLDGEYEANDLIRKFANAGYDIIAITDHNTCEAYINLGDAPKIKVITGLEADAIIGKHTYDFLCYDFALDDVYKYAKEKYETVDKRQKKIFNALVDLCKNNNIPLRDIDTYNPHREYAHAALYRMLDSKFLEKHNIMGTGDLYRLSTIDESFPLYLDMHIVWPDITELTKVIHQSGGKVFLAHPYRYNRPVEEVLDDVKDYVDGIEICNNPASFEEVEYLYRYAKENNLLVSCGSDYHGDERYSMDCEYLTEKMLEDVISWIK